MGIIIGVVLNLIFATLLVFAILGVKEILLEWSPLCKVFGHRRRFYGSSMGDGTSHKTKYYLICDRCGKTFEEGHRKDIDAIKGNKA